MGQVDFINVNYKSLQDTANLGHTVVSTGVGKLIKILACNSAASIKYLMVFDATSLPSNGTAPTIATIAVPASSSIEVDLAQVGGLTIANGIVLAESSSVLTLTSAGTDLIVTAFYAILSQL